MERLTTDNPQGNMASARNLFYIKDGETWVLGGGPDPDYKDITLYDFVRRIANLHGLDIITSDNEAMGEHLYDLLLDGVDTIEGVVALIYTAAWAFSELRERLKAYEDKVPFNRLDEAAALVKARDEGRVTISPPPAKEGDPKPDCFYDDGASLWCLGLSHEGDDEPVDRCKQCWYYESGDYADDRAEAETALGGGGDG